MNVKLVWKCQSRRALCWKRQNDLLVLWCYEHAKWQKNILNADLVAANLVTDIW